MSYILEGALHTDGDFSVDLDYFTNKEFTKHITHTEGSEDWSILVETDDYLYIRKFLEELITAYRVRTNYWLVEDLYNLTSKIIEVLDNNDFISKRCYLSGNYDGTELFLLKS